MNKRGEVATITIVVLVIAAGLIGTMIPKMNPLSFFSRKSAVQSEKEHTKSEITTPMQLGDKIVYKKEKINSKKEGVRQERLSVLQRTWDFVQSLGLWAVGLAIFFPAVFAGIIMWIKNVIDKWRGLSQNFIKGMNKLEKEDPETFSKVAEQMSKSMDAKDKAAVKEMKEEIK